VLQVYNMCFIIRTIVYNAPLTLREVSRISGCSLPKTSRIITSLEKRNLINIRVKGRSYLIYPNLENEFLRLELLREEVSYTITMLERYSNLREEIRKLDGRIVIIFGSYSVGEADELSDIDLLIIDGKNHTGFSLSIEEFRELLRNKNPTILSIIKKHIIVKGFEEFVEEVLKWKRTTNLLGV